MGISTSDGKYFEDEFDFHAANQPQREPLRLTITPHMNAGEDNQDTLSEPKDIHIIRHGTTEENEEDKIRGTNDDVKLSDEGRKHALEAAEELRSKGLEALVTSPLSRAKETAGIIGKELGIPVTVNDKLKTWNVGNFEGKPCEGNNDTLQDYAESKPDEKVPGGESYNDFKDRSFEGIRESILANKDKKLGIVTHHMVESSLEGWNKTGQDNPSLDLSKLFADTDQPGSVRKMTMQPDSTIMQGDQSLKDKIHPYLKSFRDALVEHIMTASGNLKESLLDILKHPENLPSTGELGTFTGSQSIFKKLWADKLEKEGIDALNIKQLTGLERDLNLTHWKQELSDVGSSINTGVFKDQKVLGVRVPAAKLEDILDHPELYKVYPELKDITVAKSLFGLEKTNPEAVAVFSRSKNTIGLSSKLSGIEDTRSALLHEVQHWIQNREGWPGSSTMADMPPEFIKVFEDRLKAEGEHIHTRWQLYHRLVREVEARNVQKRMNMTPGEISKSLAKSTEDVPRDKQLVIDSFKKGNIVDMSAPIGNKNANSLSEREIKDIEEGLLAGKSFNQLEKELDIPVSTIKYNAGKIGTKSQHLAYGKESSWTPEKDSILRQGLEEGKSFTAIAKELGISRGAVAGRQSRLK